MAEQAKQEAHKINKRPKDDVSGDEDQKQAESPSLSIVYFGFPGRGEPLRMAAFFNGISYRDIFTASHAEDKKAGKRRWSGLPEVIFHDKDGNDVLTMGQSNVCLKAISQLGGKLYPEDMIQTALVDELMASVEDTFPIVVPVFLAESPMFGNDEKKAAELAKVALEDDKLPYWTTKFELRLKENEDRGHKNGFFVGDSMTVADLKYFCALKFLDSLKSFNVEEMLKTFPKVAAFFNKMKGDEEIKKFEAGFVEQQKKSEVTEHIVKGRNVYIKM